MREPGPRFRREDGGWSTWMLDSKAAVIDWQSRMVELGQISLNVDGSFGDQSVRACHDWQGMVTFPAPLTGQLLEIDGDPGPATDSSMDHSLLRDGRVSPRFRAREFRCNCTLPWMDMHRSTIMQAEHIAEYKGLDRFIVRSGHRNDHHESAVGGAFGGHVCTPKWLAGPGKGCHTSAIDFDNEVVKLTLKEARYVIGNRGGVGVVEATGFCAHLDQGPFRDWVYPRGTV